MEGTPRHSKILIATTLRKGLLDTRKCCWKRLLERSSSALRRGSLELGCVPRHSEWAPCHLKLLLTTILKIHKYYLGMATQKGLFGKIIGKSVSSMSLVSPLIGIEIPNLTPKKHLFVVENVFPVYGVDSL